MRPAPDRVEVHPQVAVTLDVAGRTLDVGQLGDAFFILDDDDAPEIGACDATLRVWTDGRADVWRIRLPSGLSPDRRRQPFDVLARPDLLAPVVSQRVAEVA